jgi:hypothetical protein
MLRDRTGVEFDEGCRGVDRYLAPLPAEKSVVVVAVDVAADDGYSPGR